MSVSDYKEAIIVGVLFVVFTREWFDNIFLDTFPVLRDMPMVYLAVKVLILMFVFWFFMKI